MSTNPFHAPIADYRAPLSTDCKPSSSQLPIVISGGTSIAIGLVTLLAVAYQTVFSDSAETLIKKDNINEIKALIGLATVGGIGMGYGVGLFLYKFSRENSNNPN